MQAFNDIVGNTALRMRLSNDLHRGTLSHAYILEGPQGCGKHMLATRIAAVLSCENKGQPQKAIPCMQCPSCRKILSGNSPDLITVGRHDKATLGVETIRELRNDIPIAPNDTDCKIYVIEDAHLMTSQAQNALLLTLEEPPSYVLFLLLCESAAPLLETIRSRAPTLRMEPISTEMIGEHICQVNPDAAALKKHDPNEFAEILISSEGYIGQALALLDVKRRQPILLRRKLARELIALCSSKRSSASVLKFLNSLGQKREELTEQFNTILLCLRDLLLCKQTENAPLCFFADREEACSLAYGFTTPTLLRYCSCVTQATEQLRKNANVRLTLTAFAVDAGLLS